MRVFSVIIDEIELCDIPIQGGSFTWRGLNKQLASRINRFLFIEEWNRVVGGAVQIVLPRLVFDHSLVPLEAGTSRNGPRPFRFENM